MAKNRTSIYSHHWELVKSTAITDSYACFSFENSEDLDRLWKAILKRKTLEQKATGKILGKLHRKIEEDSKELLIWLVPAGAIERI